MGRPRLELKRCTGECGQTLPRSAFYKRTLGEEWISSRCRSCESIRSGDRQHQRTDYQKESGRLKKYGLTPESYAALFTSQNGGCALCQMPSLNCKLSVDHDHITGEVRGLLCSSCNQALGILGDNEEGLLKALAYIRGEL